MTDSCSHYPITPQLYSQLHRLARVYMRRERHGHTYQPTALVNEAVSRLLANERKYVNASHFLATVARQMRHFLVNYAVAKKTEKRDGIHVRFDTSNHIAVAEHGYTIIDIDDLLTKLEAFDADGARVFELMYFGGLTTHEMALTLGHSKSTIDRKLRFVRAWIKTKLISNS